MMKNFHFGRLVVGTVMHIFNISRLICIIGNPFPLDILAQHCHPVLIQDVLPSAVVKINHKIYCVLSDVGNFSLLSEIRLRTK